MLRVGIHSISSSIMKNGERRKKRARVEMLNAHSITGAHASINRRWIAVIDYNQIVHFRSRNVHSQLLFILSRYENENQPAASTERKRANLRVGKKANVILHSQIMDINQVFELNQLGWCFLYSIADSLAIKCFK